MSFVANDNQQLTLTDSTFNLTQREKRVLEKSRILYTSTQAFLQLRNYIILKARGQHARGIVFASIAFAVANTACPGFCTPDTPLKKG